MYKGLGWVDRYLYYHRTLITQIESSSIELDHILLNHSNYN